MTFDDLVAVAVLIAAYLFTVLLFIFSMKIVRTIHREKIYHLNEIKERLFDPRGSRK